MIVARILSYIHALGPGDRIGLWVKGCSKNCWRCISPELQPFGGKDVDEEQLGKVLSKLASALEYRGLTISGGDPFEQPDSLLRLIGFIRGSFDDILVYTGYTIEEIMKGVSGNAGIECLKYIDVLIDGKYIDNLNDGMCVLRGSKNQNIHYLNEDIKDIYLEYIKKGRVVETFVIEDTTLLVGIINKGD